MINKITAFLLSISLIFCFTGCKENKEETTPKTEGIGKYSAVITVENYGEIHLSLDGDTAPITVQNFIDLASKGFYDGLTFHRVVQGFVIQGGDPSADGTGGSGKTITGEFSSNGYENNISHSRGVISMARLGNDYNSATSQFFIVLDDSAKSSLDGLYASFGKVTKGMEVVDKIASETKVDDYYSGLVAKQNQPKISSVKVTKE